ncbi:MAG TPA: endo-alpha-N-acetylgalactosaminidase family protein, partial [Edaphobacter sp.]|nr:endo-alpha-N-acetylgalactosaminidase family protein [Edaphobacter sp.]
NPSTPNLLIEQKSSCRLDFITGSGKAAMDWLDGAKSVRKRMPPIPNPYYHDKFQYDILCDLPRPRLPVCPFPQVEERVRQLAAMIDGAPQIVQIWGWQYRGKDTGYPAVKEVDHRLGTYEDLLKLKKTCEEHNALITLSDNYDDAYKSSPAWSDDIIARRPDGKLWFSRDWTGEPSYVLGLAKYMEGPGTERVHYTCDHYKIHDVAHIDVLTYFSIRNDWDPKHPASGIKNLQARYKVIDLFKQHGVDVTSEFIRYAFIGKVSSFQNGMSGGPCPFGGEPVPLQATIYRKSAIWGQQGHPIDTIDRVLNALFYNGYGYIWGSEDPPFNVSINQLVELYYLSHIPWFKLHQLNLETFRREGDRAILGLEDGSQVEVNYKTRDYSVHLKGVEIARNGNTFCPFDDERIAIYSLRGETLRFKLPDGWDSGKIAAISLAVFEPDRHELPVKVDGGFVTIKAPGRRPIMLYRDGAKARQRLLSNKET